MVSTHAIAYTDSPSIDAPPSSPSMPPTLSDDTFYDLVSQQLNRILSILDSMEQRMGINPGSKDYPQSNLSLPTDPSPTIQPLPKPINTTAQQSPSLQLTQDPSPTPPPITKPIGTTTQQNDHPHQPAPPPHRTNTLPSHHPNPSQITNHRHILSSSHPTLSSKVPTLLTPPPLTPPTTYPPLRANHATTTLHRHSYKPHIKPLPHLQIAQALTH